MITLIGAGQWGINLAKTLHKMGRLKNIAESNPSRREELQKLFPEIKVASLEECLQESMAVAIATPAPTHFELAQLCLKTCDVFVEKPMTLSSIQGRELVRLAQENKRVLMVGHLLVHQAAVRRAKELMPTLGKIQSLYLNRLNLGKVRQTENALWSLGVHDLAILNFWFGETPKLISAIGQKSLGGPMEDDVQAHLRFSDGAMAHVHSSWNWPLKERGFKILGEKGSMVFDEIKNQLTLHKYSIEKSGQFSTPVSEDILLPKEEPLKVELENFIECIQTRNTPRTDGVAGLQVVEVLEKITENIGSL